MVALKDNAPTLDELSKHPLNQAALMVLKREKVTKQQLPPDLMPVLALAVHELAMVNEQDPRLPWLSRWAVNLRFQQLALLTLQKVLHPQELLAGTALETAEQIANELDPEATTREVD